jgi:hypothetical protein
MHGARAAGQLHATLFPTLSDYYPDVFPAARFTLERLRWARALLDSREVQVRRRGVLVSCLVPVVDMLNHRPAAHAWHRWFDDARNCLCVELNAPVAEGGTQLFLSYGPLRTWQLLQYYGMVPPTPNPYDGIDLSLGDPAALSPAAQALCARYALDANHTVRGGRLAPACWAYVRIAVATPAELRRATAAAAGGPTAWTAPLSDRNERAARAALHTALSELRARWQPAVTDNDLVRAASPGADGVATRLLVVRYRRSQLQLLDAALAALDAPV